MNYIKYIIRDIKSYHAIFLANPLLALVAIPLYLIPIGLLLGVTVGFILLVEGRPKWQSLDKYLNLIFMFSTFTSLVFASDLVLVQILAVLGNIRLGINRFEIARIAQAVLLTILLFGSIYYYMQLYN